MPGCWRGLALVRRDGFGAVDDGLPACREGADDVAAFAMLDECHPGALMTGRCASVRRDEAGLVGTDDRLGAVAGTDLGEHARDVRFHGFEADDEPCGDFSVRKSLRD